MQSGDDFTRFRNDAEGKNGDESGPDVLVRRTFILSECADKALINIVAQNKIHDREPGSVSALLREIISGHLMLQSDLRDKAYESYQPLRFNITLNGTVEEILTLEDYRKRKADKTSRTFTILKTQLSKIEKLAAENHIKGSGPRTVNALLLHIVNIYLLQNENI
ncbi:hypothetical protein [Dryocola sp. LX212]